MAAAVIHALDIAAQGETREALVTIAALRSVDQCAPIKVPADRLPELAQLWGASARQDAKDRAGTDPISGNAWEWEPFCCDSWLEFLAAAEGILPADEDLVERCAAQHRAGFFQVEAVPRVAATPRLATRRRLGGVLPKRPELFATAANKASATT